MEQALYIVWSQDNQLGIAILDEQHRAIVSTINSLFYFIQEKLGAAAVEPTLRVLVEYTKLHFTTEERLMKQAGYLQFDEHIQLHHKLAEQTIALTQSHVEAESAKETLRFLKDWWINHINVEDRKYAPAVRRYLGG